MSSGHEMALSSLLDTALAPAAGLLTAVFLLDPVVRRLVRTRQEDVDPVANTPLELASQWHEAFEIGSLKGPNVLGHLERALFYCALWFNSSAYAPVVVGGWLTFKLTSKWQIWQSVIRVPERFPGFENYEVDYLRARHVWGSRLLSSFLIGILANVLAAIAGVIIGRLCGQATFEVRDWTLFAVVACTLTGLVEKAFRLWDVAIGVPRRERETGAEIKVDARIRANASASSHTLSVRVSSAGDSRIQLRDARLCKRVGFVGWLKECLAELGDALGHGIIWGLLVLVLLLAFAAVGSAHCPSWQPWPGLVAWILLVVLCLAILVGVLHRKPDHRQPGGSLSHGAFWGFPATTAVLALAVIGLAYRPPWQHALYFVAFVIVFYLDRLPTDRALSVSPLGDADGDTYTLGIGKQQRQQADPQAAKENTGPLEIGWEVPKDVPVNGREIELYYIRDGRSRAHRAPVTVDEETGERVKK